MPDIVIQNPFDQPSGRNRLLLELRDCLDSGLYDEFYVVVAFAKQGPLIKLSQSIKQWNKSNKQIKAIIGVDLQGTSIQALEYALNNFSEVRIITGSTSNYHPTFHPKIYFFKGKDSITAFVGSNNLTVGGTEINLESYIKLNLKLPTDTILANKLDDIWLEAVTYSLSLDETLLQALKSNGILLDESIRSRYHKASQSQLTPNSTSQPSFPTIQTKPPNPIPKAALALSNPNTQSTSQNTMSQGSVLAQELVIQISPHHNGEVFLSKTAVDQNHAFFSWPFTGLTVPKKSKNQSYPQRVPDPIVSLSVHDVNDAVIISLNPYDLNMVFYQPKSEIRIQVTPEVVRNAPDGSILVMSSGLALPGLDYVMNIYVPGSPLFNVYLSQCNQVMPSGGKSNPRKFGWI